MSRLKPRPTKRCEKAERLEGKESDCGAADSARKGREEERDNAEARRAQSSRRIDRRCFGLRRCGWARRLSGSAALHIKSGVRSALPDARVALMMPGKAIDLMTTEQIGKVGRLFT